MYKILYLFLFVFFKISIVFAVLRSDVEDVFNKSHTAAAAERYSSVGLILSPTSESAVGIMLNETTVLTVAHAFKGSNVSKCVFILGYAIRSVTPGRKLDLSKTITELPIDKWSYFDVIDHPTVSFQPFNIDLGNIKKLIADKLRSDENLDKDILNFEDFSKNLIQFPVCLIDGALYKMDGSDLRILKLHKPILSPHGFLPLCTADPKTFSNRLGCIPGMGMRIKTNNADFNPNNIIMDSDSLTYQRHLITQKMSYDSRGILLSKFYTNKADENYFVVKSGMHDLEGLFVSGDNGAPWITANNFTSWEIASVVSQSIYSPFLMALNAMYKDEKYNDIKEKIMAEATKEWPFYNISYSVYPHLEWIKEMMEKK